MYMSDQVSVSLERLERWIDLNGWAGFDPYDVRDTRVFEFLEGYKWSRYLANSIRLFAPMLARQVLRVRPKVNAKAIGLLALGYLARFEASERPEYQQKAIACLEWMENHISPGCAGACWGYPFNWRTRIEIPAGTPSAVVSAIGGWAFLEAYRLLKDQRYLEIARTVGDFFLQDLNLDKLDNDRACFSYTPLDHFHVHNANLFVAAHLYELSALIGETRYLAAAEAAVLYSLGEQNRDGSWYYWGPPDQLRYTVDHYHTGFVLRCLDRICLVSPRREWEEALRKGFQFYTKYLLEPDGLPRQTPEKIYPVDIHSCAEAILCLSQLSRRYPEATASRLSDTLNWTLREMQGADGHFYYRKYPRRTIRIAFMRWGQAWMFWALSVYKKR